MNLHRLDLVSLSLFMHVVRSGSISKDAALAVTGAGVVASILAFGLPQRLRQREHSDQ